MLQTNEKLKLVLGCILVLSINALWTIYNLKNANSSLTSNYLSLYALLFPFYQFIYVLPLGIVLAILRQRELLKGVIIGVLITFLLSAGTCFLLPVFLKK